MLTFDEPSHTYFWNSNPVPSVTQIIDEWMPIEVAGHQYHLNRYSGVKISSRIFHDAADFGSAVHLAINLHIQGRLDYSQVHPAIMVAVKKFDQWHKTHRCRFTMLEKQAFDERYMFAGTVDIVAQIGRQEEIIDIKTGAYSTAGIQLAAYQRLIFGDRTVPKYVLYIPKADGKEAKLLPYKGEWNVFLSMLNTYKWRTTNYGNKRNGLREADCTVNLISPDGENGGGEGEGEGLRPYDQGAESGSQVDI